MSTHLQKTDKELSISGKFYRRRDLWIKHVMRLPKEELSHTEKLVAVFIALTINPESREWATSQDKICQQLELGPRVVKSAVAKLKSMKLLKTTRVRINNNPKRFNSYSLVAVEDAAWSNEWPGEEDFEF